MGAVLRNLNCILKVNSDEIFDVSRANRLRPRNRLIFVLKQKWTFPL